MGKGRIREWWKERRAEKSAERAAERGATSNSDAEKGPGASGSTTPTLDLVDQDPYAIPPDAAAKGPPPRGVCEEYTVPDPLYGSVSFSPSAHAGATPDTDAKREARYEDRAVETGRPTKNPKGQSINDPTVNPVGVDPEEWALQQYRQCRYGVAVYESTQLFGPVYETLRTLVNDKCRTPADDARFPALQAEVVRQGEKSIGRIEGALAILDKRHKAHQHEVKFERDLILSVRDEIKAQVAGASSWKLTPSLLPPEEKKPKSGGSDGKKPKAGGSGKRPKGKGTQPAPTP